MEDPSPSLSPSPKTTKNDSSSSHPVPPTPPEKEDPILAAITALSKKFDSLNTKSDTIETKIGKMASKEDLSEIQKTMASKLDLQKFETSILKSTKRQISGAVDPLNSDLFDLKERVQHS